MACPSGLHPDLHLSAASIRPGVQEAPPADCYAEDPASASAEATREGVQGGAASKPLSHAQGGKSVATTEANGAESRKQPPSREVHADELRGGDVVEVGGRWLRLRSRSIEASAVRVRFADDTEVRYRRGELVRIIRGGLAPYVGEDGDIDWCRWGIDNGESPVDEYEETG